MGQLSAGRQPPGDLAMLHMRVVRSDAACTAASQFKRAARYASMCITACAVASWSAAITHP